MLKLFILSWNNKLKEFLLEICRILIILLIIYTAPTCCRANSAECLSCQFGQTIEEYCQNNPRTVGCPGKLLQFWR